VGEEAIPGENFRKSAADLRSPEEKLQGMAVSYSMNSGGTGYTPNR
jgi:hypothetical protein